MSEHIIADSQNEHKDSSAAIRLIHRPAVRHPLSLAASVLIIIAGLFAFSVIHPGMASAQGAPASATDTQDVAPIVGSWLVDANGAPFVQHVMVFNADGTFIIDNPEAGDPRSSDSLGAGAWAVVPHHPDQIYGTFEEINADRTTNTFVSRLEVKFTLTMQGINAFTGPAGATYFNPDGSKQNKDPYPATLVGTRIQPK